MFNQQALKKISRLLQMFPGKIPDCRVRLRSWDDFRKIPVSERKDIEVFLKSGPLKDIFNITATSGSTSSRMLIVHSRKAYEMHLRRLVKIYRSVGVKKGMVCLNLCSYELNSGGRLMEAAFKEVGCGVIPLGPVSTAEKVLEAVQLIKTLKPDLINAYTNQLFDVFAVLGRRHSVRRCLVNGEPLWPAYRKRIEHMGGVHVHDHYGAMEISGLAVAIKPSDEYMQVVTDGLLLEVLEDSGKTSQTGVGALLVTDLENTSMPFIRYRLGDRVELARRRGTLGIKVLGRTQDSLLVNGVVVLRRELVRAVNDFLGHPHFFFVIDKDPVKYYDKLIVNIAKGIPKQFESLNESVSRAVGIDRCINVRSHQGAIPRTINGKIRYFVDARKEA